MPCEASAEDTTATLSTAVPPDTDAAVAAGTGAGVEAAGDAAMPGFLGATMTLLQRDKSTVHLIGQK